MSSANIRPQDGLRGVSNSHRNIEARLLGETALTTCPLCDRPFADEEQARRIHARWEDHQRELAEEIQAKARKDGIEAGRASAQEDINALITKNAAAAEQLVAAVIRADNLEANMDAVVNQRVGEGVEAYRQQTEAKYAAEALVRIQENQKLNEHVAKLQRDLANRKPTDLGDSAQRDTHRDLTAAFPQDKITEVAKGTKGGDLPHFVNHKGNEVGSTLHEIKNVKNWSDSYAIKARADKVAGKFDYAVVTTTKLPAGERDLAFREHCVICSPALTVGVTRMLRAAIIKVSEARADGKDGDKKAAELWGFFTSGQGRELLMSASDDITKLRALDKTLLNHAKKHVDDSEKVFMTQEQKFDDIFAAIDRIVETD